MATAEKEKQLMEIREEQVVEANHQFDNAVILMFIVLLILTLLTCWFFKYRRVSFVHETTLSIFYGLIAGIIIRYTASNSSASSDSSTFLLPPPANQSANNGQLAPRTVFVEMRFVSATGDPANETRIIYQYDLRSQVQETIERDGSIDDKATFDPELFFNVLLPPIIFYAGYIMKRRNFFRNIGAILTIAIIGTALAAFVTAIIVFCFSFLMPSLQIEFTDALFFGALISATDPVTVLAIFNELHVDVDLYAIVFGESVLNDVIAIVMAKSVEAFQVSSISSSSTVSAVNSTLSETSSSTASNILSAVWKFAEALICSFLIGFGVAIVTSLVTKFTKLRDLPLLETGMFVLLSYSTFVLAETLGLTGIVALLFCGIMQAHYSYNNLSMESRFRTRQVLELFSFLAENFVFVYIGVSTVTFRHHHWNVGFIIVGVIAILVARALNIYPLCFLLNLGRRFKITLNMQHMLMFVGLRGAMAFALAIRSTTSEVRRLFFSTTLVIVIATVLVCGSLTTRVLSWLHIQTGVNEGTNADLAIVGEAPAPTHQPGRSDAAAAATSKTVSRDVVRAQDPDAEITGDGRGAPMVIIVPGSGGAGEQPTPVRKAKVFAAWSSFDARYMKPFLTHAQPPLTETLPSCMYRLAKLLSSAEQLAKVAPSYARFENDAAEDGATCTIIGATADYATSSASDSEVADAVSNNGVYRRGHRELELELELDVKKPGVSRSDSEDVGMIVVHDRAQSVTQSESDTSLISVSGTNNNGS